MLAVHDVNVTSTAQVMTPDRGSKVASEVLSPAQTGLRRHGYRSSGPQDSPGHYGSSEPLAGHRGGPLRVGGDPLDTPRPQNGERGIRTPANCAVSIDGARYTEIAFAAVPPGPKEGRPMTTDIAQRAAYANLALLTLAVREDQKENITS